MPRIPAPSRSLVITLLAGLLTTLTIAWIAAVFVHTVDSPVRRGVCRAPDYTAPFRIADAWGLTDLQWTAYANDGRAEWSEAPESLPLWSRARSASPPFPSAADPPRIQMIEVAAGWPWRALRATLHDGPLGTPWPAGNPYTTISGIGLPPKKIQRGAIIHQPRALPYVPNWSGLLADTALFSSAWSIPILIIPAAHRIHRRRRGLCPGCAYDLRADWMGGCPECGWGRSPSA